MQTVLPLSIIIVLGLASSAIVVKLVKSKYFAMISGACLATILWIAGSYTLIYLTAPKEAGDIKIMPIIYTFITAFLPSAALVFFTRRDKKA